MFEKEEQQFLIETYNFFITQICSEPALHVTCDAIMHELTAQYVMINCVECFREI